MLLMEKQFFLERGIPDLERSSCILFF